MPICGFQAPTALPGVHVCAGPGTGGLQCMRMTRFRGATLTGLEQVAQCLVPVVEGILGHRRRQL